MGVKSSEKPKDRRIAKTRAALGQSLFEHLQTTEWNDITIQSLCDKANVARSSFYAHFATVSELLESLISENFPHFEDLNKPPAVIATIDWLIDHISQNRKLFFRLNNSPSAAIVLTGFKAQTKATLERELNASGIRSTDLQLNFIVGGVFESVHGWARTWKLQQVPKLKVELDKFAKTILRLVE